MPRRVTHASESGTALSRWSVARGRRRQPPVQINGRCRERRARDGEGDEFRILVHWCVGKLRVSVGFVSGSRMVREGELAPAGRRRRLPTQMLRGSRAMPSRAPPRALFSSSSRFDGVLVLAAPSPCVMPGGRPGDGSPSTHGVAGRYTGEVCARAAAPTRHGAGRWSGSTASSTKAAGGRGVPRRGRAGRPRHRRRVPRRVARRPPAGDGANLYGGKWGYDRWEGPFADDRPHGEGVMRMVDGRAEQMSFERGELAGDAPCNWEHEKAVFFRRLSPRTDDARMRAAVAPRAARLLLRRARGRRRVDAHLAQSSARSPSRPTAMSSGEDDKAGRRRAAARRSTTPSRRARARDRSLLGQTLRNPRRASAARRRMRRINMSVRQDGAHARFSRHANRAHTALTRPLAGRLPVQGQRSRVLATQALSRAAADVPRRIRQPERAP